MRALSQRGEQGEGERKGGQNQTPFSGHCREALFRNASPEKEERQAYPRKKMKKRGKEGRRATHRPHFEPSPGGQQHAKRAKKRHSSIKASEAADARFQEKKKGGDCF